jgi:ADP-ribose pyrophosphatase YjhB (NUDIX family)
VRAWTVAAGLVEQGGDLLLVANRRADGHLDWTPPGGVIEAGEPLLDGLTREVLEETGLTVSMWHGPCYEVRVKAELYGWDLRVEVWQALGFSGTISIEDPDGIVEDARFVPLRECAPFLETVQPWVREPVSEWIASRTTDQWMSGREFSYRVEGPDRARAKVIRVQ